MRDIVITAIASLAAGIGIALLVLARITWAFVSRMRESDIERAIRSHPSGNGAGNVVPPRRDSGEDV